MITALLIIFIILVIHELVQTGEAYIYFSRIILFANSFMENKPSRAIEHENYLEIQYTYGKTQYAIMILKRNPLNWTSVAALKNGKWIDRTEKISYFAGPFKNLHGLGLFPSHISAKYEKLAFRFPDGSNIHVSSKDSILLTLRKAYKMS